MVNQPRAKDPFVQLNFNSRSLQGKELIFSDFSEIITTKSLAEVVPCLQRVSSAQKDGNYVVGFLSYEIASALDPAKKTRKPDSDLPLLWFGVAAEPNAGDEHLKSSYKPVIERVGAGFKEVTAPRQIKGKISSEFDKKPYHLGEWTPKISQKEYSYFFSRVMTRLRNGDTYQLNFTFPLCSNFSGCISSFYNDLRRAQSADYCAWVHTHEFDILTLSPELFFEINGNKISTRPMKGTRARGLTIEEDREICKELSKNPKERAENVMIVDLLRNDLGQISVTGSVQFPDLFTTEIYPSIIQMTSTVKSTLKPGMQFLDVLKALFPCGSIVGAPKIKTMELISQYETEARGVYCGSVGLLSPNGHALFNVGIRTVTIKKGKTAEYHVGSGLVIDSECSKEYRECLLKSKLLGHANFPKFQLLETLLFDPQCGYYLLDKHLLRLKKSAAYFQYHYNSKLIEISLSKAKKLWSESMRVRILLNPDGSFDLQHHPFKNKISKRPYRIKLAPTAIDSKNPFLFHKTTHRTVYDKLLHEDKDGADDVLLFNERGELTECTIANIALKLGGEWFTPPVNCGLLAGTKRDELLEKGLLKERVMTLQDLKQAEGIKLFNSVRGEYPAELVTHVVI